MAKVLALVALLVLVGCSEESRTGACDCDLNGDGMCGGPDYTRWSIAWNAAQENGGFCSPGSN